MTKQIFLDDLRRALGGVACAMGGRFDGEETRQVTYTVEEAFTKIVVEESAANLTIKRSENGTTYAVCDETDKITHSMSVSGGVLTLQEKDHRAWYNLVGISTSDRTVTLYLDGDAYDSLRVSMSSGDISCTIPATFGEAKLTNASGHITCASNTVFTEAEMTTSSGDIICGEQISFGNLKLTTSSGRIDCAAKASGSMRLDGCAHSNDRVKHRL